MSETELVPLISQVGFPIAIALYLLWERTKTFSESKGDMVALNKKYEDMNAILLEVVKANTVAQTELRVTIQKLCEIVNGRPSV
jgi:uroporphyrinogen-III decarboxylase